MSTSKKRKSQENDKGNFDTFDIDIEMTSSRKHLKVSSSPGKNRNEAFLSDKKSMFQQLVEQQNEKFYREASQITDPEKMKLAVAEHLRVMQEIKRLYKPTPGYAVSMGSDDCFQLGVSASSDADKDFQYPPTLVRHAKGNIVQVAGGGIHSVALNENGEVLTFGTNDDYALGREIDDESMMHLVSPITTGFKSEDHNRIVAVDAGDSHSIFLSISGNAYTCGMYKDVDSGKFRDVPSGSSESPKGSNKVPVLIKMPQKVRAICAGQTTNVAILEDDTVVTWGMGHYGQLARSKNMGAKLTTVDGGNQVYDLGKMWIGEEYHTGEFEMERKNNEMVFKLDKNGKKIPVMKYRYFEDLIKREFLTPAPVCWAGPSVKRSVLSVACGELHLLIAAREGSLDTKLYSSGHNGFGQLGHGDSRERHELTSIKSLEGKMISKVAAGTSHSLALDIFGIAVFAWGRSDYGQCGHTSSIRVGDVEKSPKRVAFPSNLQGVLIKDIAAGPLVSMAITQENDIYTWGFGESGATGHKGDEDILRPKKLDVLRKYKNKGPSQCHVLNVSGGAQHSLAVIERFA